MIGVTVVPRAAEAGAQLLGIDSGVGQLGLSGLLGLGIYFAHRRLRPRIEGVFFAERHALDSGVQELLVRLRRATDFETLVHEMADTLNRLVRPESCVVYARSADVFTPLVAHGAGRATGAHPRGRAAGDACATAARRSPWAASPVR